MKSLAAELHKAASETYVSEFEMARVFAGVGPSPLRRPEAKTESALPPVILTCFILHLRSCILWPPTETNP